MNSKTVLIFVLIAIGSIALGILYDNQTDQPDAKAEIFKSTRSVMDTTVTIAVIDTNETHATQAIDRAFDQIYYVDALMSSYKNDSQLNILNQEGTLEDADTHLINVLEHSIYYSQVSDGAFDVTIKPILDLWSSKYSPGGTFAPPTQEEIDETLKLVDYSKINIEGNTINLGDGMGIVLGGIAKGYAVDLAIESLETDGIENGFVNAGGDGRYIGTKDGGAPWVVGLQNPDKEEEAVAIMNMHNMAVATSGNYERYFSDAAKVSHISDPRTGYSAQSLISATVIAESAMDADALATAVFVLGEAEGIEMIESLDGVECLIITADKRIITSSGFDEYLQSQ